MNTDKELRQNIASYFAQVTMPGGYTHCLPETLKIIDAYYIGKYTGSGKDTNGEDLIFENVTKPTVDVAEKLTDIDTKHILFLNDSTPGIRYQVYKMQRQFKQWVKQHDLGVLLNDIGHNYPKYGHVVIKKGFDKKWKVAKIQNFRVNPAYEWLEQMPWVYEINEMDKADILSMKWNGDLGYIKDSLDTSFIVYECYEKNYSGEGKKWKRYIRAGVYRKNTGSGVIETTESQYTRGKSDYLPSIILHEDELNDIKEVYKELKWEKVDGRWLGLGFSELVFDEQVQTNTICYLSGKAMFQKAMHLYYTKDESVMANAIDSYDFGQIIKTYDAIQPVNMSNNADITAYRDVGARVQSLVSKKTHNTDIAMGETLPAQTPLGLGQLQASLTMSFFEKKREVFGLFVVDLVKTDYIKEFKANNKKEHYVIFPRTAEEFEIMVQAYLEEFRTDLLVKTKNETGNILPWDEVERKSKLEEERIRTKGEVAFKQLDKAYENIDVNVDIEVTGEGTDVKTKQSIYQFAMSTLASNPQLMLNATTRELFFRLLEQTGESPVKMGLLREAVDPNQAQLQAQQVQGGGQVPQLAGATAGTPNLPDAEPNI